MLAEYTLELTRESSDSFTGPRSDRALDTHIDSTRQGSEDDSVVGGEQCGVGAVFKRIESGLGGFFVKVKRCSCRI